MSNQLSRREALARDLAWCFKRAKLSAMTLTNPDGSNTHVKLPFNRWSNLLFAITNTLAWLEEKEMEAEAKFRASGKMADEPVAWLTYDAATGDPLITTACLSEIASIPLYRVPPAASGQKLNDDTVARLKLLCRMLDLENAFNDQLYSDSEALFSIFGSMRVALENLVQKSKE